jgi:hypothetical protein
MSIIVTHISQFGIVHAADSNLTFRSGKPAGTARKLFPVPSLKAAVTVAGNFSVGGKRMDCWMKRYIRKDRSTQLRDFVQDLTNAINQRATAEEKQEGYFLHVAGYVAMGATPHPEFYHITNYTIDKTTGGYSVLNANLTFSEDFWSQNSSIPASQLFLNHRGFIYCNGFPSGRIAYFQLLNNMASFKSQVWLNKSWQFRPPDNLVEEAEYLKHDMELIGLFFQYSNYSAPLIGGPIVYHTIASP